MASSLRLALACRRAMSASVELLVVVADLFDEELLNAEVAGRVIEHAIGAAAVASGTACFLVVGFHAAGQVVVQDEANVGLVDAHAEGVGGDDDRALALHEALLAALAIGLGHAGVVSADDALGQLLLKVGGEFFDGLAGGAVDDAGSGRRRRDRCSEGAIFLAIVAKEAGGVAQVGPVESGDVHLRRAQFQVRDDVGADLRRRGGGERDGDGRAEGLANFGQAHVFGAEVVSPEADAVGLVDHEEARLEAAAAEREMKERRSARARRRECPRSRRGLFAGSRAAWRRLASCSAAAWEWRDRVSWRTWSAIRAISGETTMVSPPRATAGSW